MLGVNEGKEVDGEGAQSLQNIWLEGEAENTPGKAGTASASDLSLCSIGEVSSRDTQ